MCESEPRGPGVPGGALQHAFQMSYNATYHVKTNATSCHWTSSLLPDITGRTALAVRPDVVNAKYHVITNATYNRDPHTGEVQTRHEY